MIALVHGDCLVSEGQYLFITITAEVVPSSSRAPWKRWWVEMMVQSDPLTELPDDVVNSVWHYWRKDFYAHSLRKALKKSLDMADEIVAELQEGDVDRWPWPIDTNTGEPRREGGGKFSEGS